MKHLEFYQQLFVEDHEFLNMDSKPQDHVSLFSERQSFRNSKRDRVQNYRSEWNSSQGDVRTLALFS